MSNILHSQERPKVLEHVAGNVRRYRQMRGLSQEALALASGVSRRMIVGIERGDANVSLATLDRLAEALGVRFADLVQAAASEAAQTGAVAWAGSDPRSSGTLLAGFPARHEAELWHWSLAPAATYDSTCNYAGWHETVYVVEGELVITFPHMRRTIAAGEFHAFACDEPRRYLNEGATLVHFIRSLAH